jgi:hypothetical protein
LKDTPNSSRHSLLKGDIFEWEVCLLRVGVMGLKNEDKKSPDEGFPYADILRPHMRYRY